jgi:hypothetical protein
MKIFNLVCGRRRNLRRMVNPPDSSGFLVANIGKVPTRDSGRRFVSSTALVAASRERFLLGSASATADCATAAKPPIRLQPQLEAVNGCAYLVWRFGVPLRVENHLAYSASILGFQLAQKFSPLLSRKATKLNQATQYR